MCAVGTRKLKTVSDIWNLPNVLTMLRIVAVPFFVWACLVGGFNGADSLVAAWVAFALFVAAMITDKLDGDIARSRGLVTNFGKIADPIADKSLMIAALVCLNIIGELSVWVSVIIIVRELGITVWRMVLLRRGTVVAASKGGKIKTTLQAVAVGLYLAVLPGWMAIPTAVVMWCAVLVTVVTGIQYIVDNQRLQRQTGGSDTSALH